VRNEALVRVLLLARTLTAERLTLEELARVSGVTTRTVRRDLEALHAAGFSIRSTEDPPRRYWRERRDVWTEIQP
jgi:predicted DNA-binding transcriptional regulator YafY